MKPQLQRILLFLIFVVLTACEGHQLSLTDRDEFAPPPPEPSLTTDETAAELFDEVQEMFEDLLEYTSEELEALQRDELLELSMPLLMFWENTIRLNRHAVSGIEEPLRQMAEYSRKGQLNNEVHKELSSEIRFILSENRFERRDNVDEELDKVKEILLGWVEDQSKSDICRELFHTSSDQVILFPGDNIGAANYYCPEDSFFYLTRGTYTGQSVELPKKGNHWVGSGIGPVILDGHNRNDYAFTGRMQENRFSHFEIRNYSKLGLLFIDTERNENVEISNMTFRNIAGDLNGEEYGAIKTEWSQNLLIEDSHFENVASAIRIVNSIGPLSIKNNSALNPGRNFFQCDKCSGGGIRITGNTMVHESQYGTDVLEDYINLFQSDGDPNDWILVANNRARGHGGSHSGSFIMLGDSGGSYQEAVNNIAVNPGQVGIGAAGGDFIRIESNRVFGEQWEGSNVGIYSTGFGSPCSNHEFPGGGSSEPNRINWTNSAGNPNPAWTEGDCGIDNETLRENIITDPNMGAEIWDDWEPS